jgi:hypothetical protein
MRLNFQTLTRELDSKANLTYVDTDLKHSILKFQLMVQLKRVILIFN